MASITIQDVDPAVMAALEEEAKRHGTTPEQEAHRLLTNAAAQLREPQRLRFSDHVARWRAAVGSVELDDLVEEQEASRDRSPAPIDR